MRYDKLIKFVKSDRTYDPDSGEWTEKVEEVEMRANVTHTGASAQSMEFGDVLTNRFTVRLQTPYTGIYDYIDISGERYTPEGGYMPSVKRSIVVRKDGGN